VDRLKSNEAKLSAQAEAHEAEVQDLKRKVTEATENFEVVKHDAKSKDQERKKNVDELRAAKEKCYEISMECAKNLKSSFAKVGAFSSEQKFIRGDPDGVIQWISGEAKAFEEILSDRGDFCAFAGARGATSILEKVSCDHAKVVVQLEFALLADDIKNPSAEASALSGKFYSGVWLKGGREVANEAIRRKEKESHDTSEEARRVEEAAERARLVGMHLLWFSFVICFSFGTNKHILQCS
jgi:hypothetical protein